MYEEYETRCYYWESVVLARKFLIVAVIVFLKNVGLQIQLLATLGVVVVALLLQVGGHGGRGHCDSTSCPRHTVIVTL
jgi:hypothetical protein